MKGYFFDRQIPIVQIGITLEEDGWWAYCPECDIAMGPFSERVRGAQWRGYHLIYVHGDVPFRAGYSKGRTGRKRS